MAMNNVYYRATHLIHNDEYGQLRAGLRMNIMANPGLDKVTFERTSRPPSERASLANPSRKAFSQTGAARMLRLPRTWSSPNSCICELVTWQRAGPAAMQAASCRATSWRTAFGGAWMPYW